MKTSDGGSCNISDIHGESWIEARKGVHERRVQEFGGHSDISGNLIEV